MSTATKTATTAKDKQETTQAGEPASIAAIKLRLSILKQDRIEADAEKQRLADELETTRKQIAERQAAQESIDREIALAERQAIDEQRKILPPAVTLKSATAIANKLRDAFNADRDAREAEGEGYKSRKSAEQTAKELWLAIDDCRCELLTPEVDEDARQITLAVEGVVSACDQWESLRRPELVGVLGSDGEPLLDIRGDVYPSDSAKVKQMLRELENVLAGESQTPIEGIGQLLQQNVTINQICQMHGLVMANGQPDLASLGMLVDRCLGRAGFYREINPWSHLKALGAMNLQDAWAIRSQSLERRRELSHNLPGSAQRLNDYRPGRDAVIPLDLGDDGPLHHTDVRHRLYNDSRISAERDKPTDLTELKY